MADDLYDALKEFFVSNSAAAPVRALLVSGATSVYEAGEIDTGTLNTAEIARRTAGNPANCLLLTLQDAGEEPDDAHSGHFKQYAAIRIFDRGRAYTNLKALRKAIKTALADRPVVNVSIGSGRGLLDVRYDGRTGLRFDKTLDSHWEGITVTAVLISAEFDN